MRRLESLQQLSGEELARVRRTLLRRYRDSGDRSPVDVSFGVAEKGGRADPQRREAICFYVRHKSDSRRHRTIPTFEEVRLKRGAGYVSLRLPTDVMDAEAARWELTAGLVRHLDGLASATIGGLLCWKWEGSCESEFCFGALTVGHLFSSISPVPEKHSRSRLQLFGLKGCAEREFGGRLLARTAARDGARADVALVEMTHYEFARCAATSLPANPQSLPIRSASQLARDVGRTGEANPGGNVTPFRVLRYFPRFTLIPQVGPIAHVLDVESPVPGAFRPGSSGSLWRIDGDAACLQFAGWLHPTDPSRSYRRGLGQSLAAVFDWAGEALNRIARHEQDATRAKVGVCELRLIDPRLSTGTRVTAAPDFRIETTQEHFLA